MTDAAPSVAPEGVFRLIYRSRDQIPMGSRKVELGALFSAARSNNKEQNITGALLVSDDWFVQVLEGDEAVVRELFAHIEKDPRHDSVSVVDAQTVDARVFARWAMAKVSAEDGKPDIPLIATTKGVHSAASRGTTPDQEALLDIMRDAMRGESQSA